MLLSAFLPCHCCCSLYARTLPSVSVNMERESAMFHTHSPPGFWPPVYLNISDYILQVMKLIYSNSGLCVWRLTRLETTGAQVTVGLLAHASCPIHLMNRERNAYLFWLNLFRLLFRVLFSVISLSVLTLTVCGYKRCTEKLFPVPRRSLQSHLSWRLHTT